MCVVSIKVSHTKNVWKLIYWSSYSLFLWPAVHEQPLWLFSVTSVSGGQIINNPWVLFSHYIPPMIKISNLNSRRRRTQATGLGVMIGRCSLNCQHVGAYGHPANVGCSLYRYLNDDISNHNDQRPKRKTWTREDNQLALDCFFKSNKKILEYEGREGTVKLE